MTEEEQAEFDTYYARCQQSQQQIAAHVWKETDLSLLEHILLKVMFLAERGKLTIADPGALQVVNAGLAKLTNEGMSFIGALSAGSLVGAYHHVRAVVELLAGLRHIFESAADKEERVARFVEWPRIAPFLRRRVLQHRLGNGEVDQATFDRENIISDAAIAHATPAQVDAWTSLFGKKVSTGSLRHWHKPPITELIEALGRPDVSGLYDIACNAAHYSPIGHRLADATRLRLLGWGDDHSVHMAIGGMIGLTLQVAEQLSRHSGDVLVGALLAEADAYAAASPSTRPRGASRPWG